jgi:beta-N-acetylhexosaminidase
MQSNNAGMSIAEQIGQIMVAGFFGLTATPEIIDLIQNHHVGNIILFSRNVADPQQLKDLTRQLQSIAREAGQRYPLLIMLDQENGMVRRLGQGATIFPGNMTLGAVGSEQDAYNVALASGRELKALGVNMNLAPDVDVNNNAANPVIGVRSFGEDPQMVARLGAAQVRGYSAAGMLTSIKHFPGHGDTAVDSHLALPVVPYDLERLERMELVPFRSGIEAGATTVMIAHMYLPEIMKQAMLPSTISPEIVNGLLRQHLGYDGVVISDCLEMKAVANTIGVERGAVLALQAGTDLILISHHYEYQLGGINAIKAALQDGTLQPQTLEQAVARVLKLKGQHLTWDETLPEISIVFQYPQADRERASLRSSLEGDYTTQNPDTSSKNIVGSQEHKQLSDQVYERSTTLVRDDAGLLPLRLAPEQRLLVLLLRPTIHSQVSDRDHPGSELVEYIQQRHANVQMHTASMLDTAETQAILQQALDTAAITIVVTHNAHIDNWQAEFVRGLLKNGRPLINVAAFNPYDLLSYPELGTYLVTYESTPPAFAAAARVLFGEIQAQGHLPVSLPGIYEIKAQ